MSWHCSVRNWEFFHGEPDSVELSMTREEWGLWLSKNIKWWRTNSNGEIRLNIDSEVNDGWIPVYFSDNMLWDGRPGVSIEWLEDKALLPESLKKYLV